MKKILIPTDFSAHAMAAAQYALELFGANNQFVLITAYKEPPAEVTTLVSMREIIRENSIENLKKMATDLKIKLNILESNIKRRAYHGEFERALTSAILETSPNVVVMPRNYYAMKLQSSFGKFSETALARLKTTMLIVPNEYKTEAEFAPIQKVG